VKCVDFTVAIVYIVLVSVIFGWGFLSKTPTSNRPSLKPLLHTEEECEGRSVNKNEHVTLPVQVCIFFLVVERTFFINKISY
jgi:Niemann-Pick C1 protein